MHDPRCAPASPHGSDPSHYLSLWPLVTVGPEVLQDSGPQVLPDFPPMFPGGDTWMSRKWGTLGLDPAESKAHSVASVFVFVFPLESMETRTDLTFPQVQ